MEPGILVIIIFASLLLLLAVGVPVAFSLFGLSMVLALVAAGPKMLFVSYIAVFATMITDVLLAIPLFIFMATILGFSGVISNLYDMAYKWFGPLRGGLAIGTLVIAALIAAMSGVGATATVTLGLLALPEMLKRGYHKDIALGCIPAGGALGPVIPPSIVMIILGSLTALSVGRLFIAGIVPGLLITGMWAVYVAIWAFIKPELAPAIAPEERATWGEKITSLRHVVAPICLIVLVLGAIYAGITTPTEAGGVGAAGALVCAAINRQLNWRAIRRATIEATLTTGLVMWLLCGGASFAAVMQISGLSAFIRDTILTLSQNPMILVGFMLLVAIFLGCFMDAGANLMICTPIFWPVVITLPIDPLWWGLVFTLTLCVGYITPPFGMNLFYLKGVAPKDVTLGEIYHATIPFCLIYLVGIAIVMLFPAIATWLPGLMI